jgi:autotransporter-associated beta strand protein
LNLGGSGNGLVSGPITAGSSTFNLTKTGSGTWTLSGSNTYEGTTTVNGGTLSLGADNVLPDNSNMVIGAGTLNAATFDDVVGTLNCTGSATINLGAGGTLAFADSSGGGTATWAGTLKITGTFVPGNGVDPGVGTNPGSLRFGTNNAGLSPSQLASISAPGWTGFALDDYGYLTATAAAGYASWASINGAGANLNDDHDNDGVDNGVEYFLGGPNGNTTGFTALPGVTNTGGILSVTWTKAGDYAGTYGNHFVVETSDSLDGAWAVEASPGNVTISGSNVTYTFPSPLGTKRFARLKVTGP